MASPSLSHQHAPSRLAFLDALRAIAALTVFVSHAGPLLYPAFDTLRPIFDLGRWGVLLFFLISGYIIPASLERQGTIRVFWIRRLLRILPLYWATIALWWLLVAAGLLTPAHTAMMTDIMSVQSSAELWSILANATLLPSLFGAPLLLGLFWTLQIEELFYLSVATLFRFRLLRFPVMLATLWIGVALVWPTQILVGLAVLYTGMLCKQWRLKAIAPRTFLVMIVLLALLLAYSARSVGELLAGMLGLATFLVALHNHDGRYGRVLPALGRISYSIYLLHPFVLFLIPRFANPLLTLGVWTCALLGVSAITYRLIEQPAIALGRRLSRPANEAPSPESAPAMSFPA